MRQYLIHRFVFNNHNKYKKYVEEWINNLTADQIAYFVLEKERLEKQYERDFTKENIS